MMHNYTDAYGMRHWLVGCKSLYNNKIVQLP